MHLGRARRGRSVDAVAALVGLGAGAQVGLMLRNRPGRGRAPARRAARRRVRRHRQPAAAAPTLRDDIAGARPAAARRRARRPRGCSRPTRCRDRRVATLGDARRRRSRSRPRAAVRPTPRTGAGRRGAHAHERHHRAAQAHRPHLRDARAGAASGPSTTRRDRGQRRAAPSRASSSSTRRWSTSAACSGCCRRATTAGRSPARAVHRRRLGRRGAAAPAHDRQPGAHRAAHGARRRPRPRRSSQRAVGRLGHRAARPRRRRRVHRALRRARARSRTRATEFGGGVAGWNLADHEQFWAAKRGSVGRAHAGCELRVVDPDDGDRLGLDEVGLLEVRAAQLGDRRLGAHHRPRAHRRRRLPLDPRPRRPDDHPRRLQGAARRSCAPRSSATPACAGRRWSAVDDERLGAVPVAAVERRPDAELDEGHRSCEFAGAHLAALRGPGGGHGGRRAAADRVGQGRSRRRA